YGNPLTTGPQVGILMNGAQVLLVQQYPDWIQVYSLVDGLVGWVRPDQVGITAADTLTGTVEYYPAIVISKNPTSAPSGSPIWTTAPSWTSWMIRGTGSMSTSGTPCNRPIFKAG
ncbi:MAG TPA: hypothetical protein PKE04_21825, partial [Clostridia bacterium]|nr:hypothetical protein [Clostridia bacterium]